jgi:iron(III) transport system substrate-binding protein
VKKTLWIVLLVLGGVAAAAWWRFHVSNEVQSVVVYVSHDEVFSEPILKDFERETGIRVRAVYDTEETKSTGAMNRLIVEKNNPQARENK